MTIFQSVSCRRHPIEALECPNEISRLRVVEIERDLLDALVGVDESILCDSNPGSFDETPPGQAFGF